MPQCPILLASSLLLPNPKLCMPSKSSLLNVESFQINKAGPCNSFHASEITCFLL